MAENELHEAGDVELTVKCSGCGVTHTGIATVEWTGLLFRSIGWVKVLPPLGDDTWYCPACVEEIMTIHAEHHMY